jgi:hypothetical protein
LTLSRENFHVVSSLFRHEHMAILWRIEFFGGLRARRDNEVITRFRTQKTAALLAYLALRPGPQPREVLVGLLWPDAEPEAARNSLSRPVVAAPPTGKRPARRLRSAGRPRFHRPQSGHHQHRHQRL